MPRNSAGTYTLPAGNPVVAGTTIDASWANDTMSDMANELTNSLSRTGAGGMLAPFRVADGSVTAPGLGFTNETNTGLYRAGTGELWLTVGGVAVAQITGNGLLIPSGKRIALPAPVNDTDAANKEYVDDLVNPVIQYANYYLGPKSSDPSVNNSGGALTAGTTYWSTTLNQLRVYNGTTWEPMPSTASLQGQTFSGTGAQTAFTLAAPTGNATNLEVFISGVRQVPTNDYTVSGTTLTFLVAPPSGTNNIYVRFAQLLALASADSSNISFLPAGTGAVTRTAQAKMRDVVSLADFGAVGDGVTDDRTAIANALATNKPLEWVGTLGKSFRIASQISHTPTADVVWYGQGATLTYAGSHAEYALRLNDATGVEFIINDLTLDGGKLCNKVLEVLNNTSLSTPSEFTATNLYVRRAKRSNAFSGGSGVLIRGAFNRVMFSGGGVSDCELPAGQGTSGSIGIAGVSIDWYGTTSYVRECVVNGFRVEKVYSSDLAYVDDQDGFVYFAPTSGSRKLPSNFSCTASEFVNCYGRSIKTQCRDTVVQACSFVRSEGLTRGFGNCEIDAQTGNGTFRDNSFSYTNAQEPLICVNVSGSLGTPGMIADGNSVVLDTSTTLSTFAQVFPSAGLFSRHAITNNKIFGKVKEFFAFNANSNKNYADVSNNYIGEMVDGVTSQKAMVYVRSSGGTSPYFANITATGNFYDNTHAPALVRDGISGASMGSALSAWSNFGFTTNNVAFNPSASGLKTNAIAHVDKIGPSAGGAYARVMDLTIPGSGTLVVDVGNIQGALLLAQMQYTTTSYLLFASDGSGNTGISVGSQWGVGNTTDPGAGTFRVWSSGTRQLTFRNTDASARSGVLMILSPGT